MRSLGVLEQSDKFDSKAQHTCAATLGVEQKMDSVVCARHATNASEGYLFCRGSTKETRGTAYVVYEDIYDAKTAVEHLSGFNVANRYLIVLYYNHNKHNKKVRHVQVAGGVKCSVQLWVVFIKQMYYLKCS